MYHRWFTAVGRTRTILAQFFKCKITLVLNVQNKLGEEKKVLICKFMFKIRIRNRCEKEKNLCPAENLRKQINLIKFTRNL